jgi:hypothetical protein
MKQKAVGFYWTFPVPWAGFHTVPANVDEAAKTSRTIAYQRELIRRYARANGYELIREAAAVEFRPDGGTSDIAKDLEPLAALCRTEDATMLLADFTEHHGWRSNVPLHDAARDLGITVAPVPADILPLDGITFNPHAHFAEWRERQRQWTADKPARAAKARARALELGATGAKNPAIAKTLNAEGLRSPTGKEWTADALRKFLATSVPA